MNTTFVPRYKWGQKINEVAVRKLFEYAILKKLSFMVRTSLLCMFNPVVRLLGLFACDCGSYTGSPSNCFPDNDDFLVARHEKTIIGQDVAFYQEAGCIKTEKALVCWKNTTVEKDSTFNVSIVYSQQVVVVVSTTKRSVLAASPYAIVYNDKNDIVGQIASDIAVVDSSGTFADSYELCIPKNPNIAVESSFTTMDFAFKAQVSDKLVAMKTSVTLKNGQYCANVNKAGFYALAYTSSSSTTSTGSQTGSAMSLIVSVVAFIFMLLV